MKKTFLFFIIALTAISFQQTTAQSGRQIKIEHADFADVNQNEIPDAFLLTGNVRISHDGAIITCNKAYYFQKENYVKAFGNVNITQNDTLTLSSRYAEYNGNLKQAFATGNPVMRSPETTLTTDTINFDRARQEVYYNTQGTILNKDNTLKSKSGRYYASQKKFQFLNAVTLNNPKYTIKSNHLDYYNASGHAYLLGPSTITGKDNFIYTEKGFYDSQKNIGHFLKKSHIKYKDRRITADSLYYDRKREFASASRNVKITDTINKGIVKGHYAELYKQKDSMFVTKHAVAVNLVENDSVYIHGKVLLVTGKPENRIIRAYNNARFYKKDLSGKCDSIHSSTQSGLTKLLGRPVLWNDENQITGDVIHLLAEKTTKKLDSLKVLNNAFMISKDTLSTGYNQVKGVNMYGKFKEGKLDNIDVVKNAEVVYYMYDKTELVGIEKKLSSTIKMQMEDGKIRTITSFKNIESTTHPEEEFPENARKLRGFEWREDERIRTKDDIFPPEEEELDKKANAQSKKEKAKANQPMKLRKETKELNKKSPLTTPLGVRKMVLQKK